jgi:hypothetical protein
LKKKVTKKLALHKETLLNLKQVAGGRVAGVTIQEDVFTDTDTDGFPSGGGDICWISDCNPCDTQRC